MRTFFLLCLLLMAEQLMAATIPPQIVLVTGASRGIGKETALLLASEPKKYKVYGTYARGPVAPKDMPGVTFLPMRLTDVRSIQQVVIDIKSREKRLDILVNNAGMGVYGPLELLSHKDIEKQFQVNLVGPVQLMREVLPVMRENKYGRIISVSSTAGAIGAPLMDVYSGSKFGLEGTTAALAGYVGKMADGADIRCRVIEPGYTHTGFLDYAGFATDIPDAFKDLWQRFLKRLNAEIAAGQPPEEVALAIRNMISDGPDSPFRVQPNKTRKAFLQKQGVDLSGDSLVLKMPLKTLYP